MSGLSTGKWRLLEVGEVTRPGDEFYMTYRHGWVPLTGESHDHFESLTITESCATPYRRRMTPAEERAEELLASLKELVGWINDAETDWLAQRDYQVIDCRAYAAIAKSEGRQP